MAVRNKRVPRAVKILRAFIGRHMKADGERILLSGALNDYLWARSIQKPPKRVKVRLVKDESEIRAYLADEKVEEKKADKKEEKKEAPKKEEPKAERKEQNESKAPEKKAEHKEAHPAAKHEHKAEPHKAGEHKHEAKK